MKTVVGFLLIIVGVVVGLWLGVWWGFVGGIVQTIHSVTPEVNAMGIACGLARIFILSGLCGWLSFGVFFGIGKSML